MRSLLPTDTNSTLGSSASSSKSTLGTSIIAPMRSFLGAAIRFCASSARSLSISARIASISVAAETIGIMILSSRPAPAMSSARTCVRNSAGRSSDMRIARQPIAGFSSLICLR